MQQIPTLGQLPLFYAILLSFPFVTFMVPMLKIAIETVEEIWNDMIYFKRYGGEGGGRRGGGIVMGCSQLDVDGGEDAALLRLRIK